MSSLKALKTLDLGDCRAVTGLRAVSSLKALTTLNLTDCRAVTSKGLRAVSSLTA